jgi:hypothetical protein
MWYRNHPRHRLERLKAPPAEAAVGDAIDGDATGLDGARPKKARFSMVIAAQAAANAATAAGKGAAQSSATTTQATPAAGSPRAAAAVTPP